MFSSPEASEISQTSRRSIFQSPEDRKNALKRVLVTTQILHESKSSDALVLLENVFEKADEIHDDIPLEEKIVNQDEVVLDSEVMCVSSKIIKTCGQEFIKEYNGFSTKKFAEKLLRFVNYLSNTSELNWSMLKREIPSFSRPANFSCLLNNINRNNHKSNRQLKMSKISVKNQASRKIRLEASISTKPKNVIKVEKEEESIEYTTSLIRKIIRRSCRREEKPLNYFKLVINPYDFGKTIENMLDLSSLCKDGMIKTATDDDLNLVVFPSPKNMVNKNANKNNFQNIIYLDKNTCQFLIAALEITEPMIPSIEF